MKSYISRKLPAATRITVFTFADRSESVMVVVLTGCGMPFTSASVLLDPSLIVAEQREFVPVEFLLQKQVRIHADVIVRPHALQLAALCRDCRQARFTSPADPAGSEYTLCRVALNQI